jgi:hypothetical protein
MHWARVKACPFQPDSVNTNFYKIQSHQTKRGPEKSAARKVAVPNNRRRLSEKASKDRLKALTGITQSTTVPRNISTA